MTFLTSQEYEQYVYRFYLNDDGSFMVDVFEEDKHLQRRTHKTREEILEKCCKHFPYLEKII
ncbi:MAG: hypothetical protein PF485_01920 [Bacteroidales bacterium]|jgi:hypothetical protein|nr:hypothetical protein [Bacteroidales bacterium]